MPKVNDTMNALAKMANTNNRLAARFADAFGVPSTKATVSAPATISYDTEVNHRPAIQ